MLVAVIININALPMQMLVTQRSSECLYELLDQGESATVSAFILSGPELKAEVQFQGPLGTAETSDELAEAIAKFDREDHSAAVHEEKMILFSSVVDFEHLSLGEYDEGGSEEEEEDDDAAEDDEKSNEDGEGKDAHSAEALKHRRLMDRKQALEARYRREQHHLKQKKFVREEGEAFQKTFKAPVEGWYRFCVRATWYQVTAEMDFRKESELGGLNERGHVYTYEEKALAEEDLLMEKDSASEEGIKDEDFLSTKEKLKTLRRLLADIEAKQKQERHRLIVHAATNEHSHSRMVLGSLFETIIFMAVTGVQIMTIRRWFKGAPALGR